MKKWCTRKSWFMLRICANFQVIVIGCNLSAMHYRSVEIIVWNSRKFQYVDSYAGKPIKFAFNDNDSISGWKELYLNKFDKSIVIEWKIALHKGIFLTFLHFSYIIILRFFVNCIVTIIFQSFIVCFYTLHCNLHLWTAWMYEVSKYFAQYIYKYIKIKCWAESF